MIKALLLIVAPARAWDRIARAQRGMAFVLIVWLVPLLVLTSLAEGYGLVHWGKPQPETGYLKRIALDDTIVYEAAQFLLSLAIVLVGAQVIKSLGETFHGRHTLAQTVTVVAYGLSPLFLFRLLDAFPIVSPWISWIAGILISMGVLYHGVPRIMEPDPPHAFGLFFMSSLLLGIITGLARLVTAWYLEGRFHGVESLIHRLASHLPIH